MKALILSITAGQGHHSVAKAMATELSARGAEVTVLDLYEYISPALKEIVSSTYLFYTAYTPEIGGAVYNTLADKKVRPTRSFSPQHLSDQLMGSELKRYLDEHQPDVILCTHIFAARVISFLQKRGQITARTYGILTDFTLHPFWEDARDIDYVVTASELLNYQLLRKGIALEKILPFGIPIHPKFGRSIPTEQARGQLGLDPKLDTLLVMSGSMGYGKIDKVIEQLDALDHDFQAIVVCGNNQRMMRKVTSVVTKKRFDVYGFTDKIDIMMDAANFIVSKPGGLTTSESLAKGLPMIMVNPIPGQEVRNVEFLLNAGLAVAVTKAITVDEAVYNMFKFPQLSEGIRANIQRHAKRDATVRLADFIFDHLPEGAQG